MCGIAGIINKDEKQRRAIGPMVEVIRHRGPDQDGFYEDGRVALGMRRLSIIDLSTGKQPIESEDGNLLIFFNGEIYNYLELRKGLEEEGHKFRTHSDTEVVLKMFEIMGHRAFEYLRGMFAFAIYNKETGRTVLARDFFGIKPLYYTRFEVNAEPKVSSKKSSGNSASLRPDFSPEILGSAPMFAFSSEMKSFLSLPGFKPEVNDEAVFNYLSYQYNPLPEAFLKGVYKLAPGHFMNVEYDGSFETLQYWHYDIEPNEKLDEEVTRKEILETMRDSVSHHMIADVPVGSFLSGGIDSSIIATLMQEVRKSSQPLSSKKSSDIPFDPVKTFTVSFKTVSEGAEAKETSGPLGTEHREISVGAEEYFRALPNAAWHFDEPVADPSAIGLYFLAREARKHVKVVLSGEGADELFGGYNIYLEPFARRRARFIPKFILRIISRLPFRGRNFAERILVRLEDRYIGNAKVFRNEEIAKLWKGERENKFDLSELYSEARKLSDSSKMQYIDVHTWLIGDILAKADKMTMAHSLELRVPFLDRSVADLARTLPDKFKWHKGETKYLLREAFRGLLPESTRKRPKLGFPTPVRSWFNKERKDVYNTILNNPYIKEKFNLDEVKRLVAEHTFGKRDNSRKIYLLLMLALWYNKFILTKPATK